MRGRLPVKHMSIGIKVPLACMMSEGVCCLWEVDEAGRHLRGINAPIRGPLTRRHARASPSGAASCVLRVHINVSVTCVTKDEACE
ncbi:hypothetical protein E2C01_064586 [Portunus trituberculatus]|uniref:Uncharacterized protein n=1 Tax=Portunus trituberculatus TaxID=210409 RepID=A0A5B7HGI9_PORTR|nr:hypothetical protein [Portunus trituberculatus]